jgi:rubrerythrin
MARFRASLIWRLGSLGLAFWLSAASISQALAAGQDSRPALDELRQEPSAVQSQPKAASTSKSSVDSDSNHMVLRGHVTCMDSRGKAIPVDQECAADSESPHLVLHTDDGKSYSFVSTDAQAAMLADTRVRQRLLQITAARHADGQLETITVQSIKDGKLYDIYYFCQLCNITTYSPGLCPCCRQELEFKEAPASEP